MTNPLDVKAGQPLHVLLELYGSDRSGVEEVRRLATLGVSEGGARDATLLGKKVGDWPTADLAKELEKAFPIDPFTLLAKAWGQVRKVRKAVVASRGPPPSAQSVVLVQHEIEAKYEPRLVLEVNGIDWFNLKLGLVLKATFESAHLDLLDGRLVGVSLGKPTGLVTVQCQGQEVAAFKRALKFAPAYRFDPPLNLPGKQPVPALQTA